MSEEIRTLLSLAEDADVGAAVQALLDERATLLSAFGAETVAELAEAYAGVNARVAELEQQIELSAVDATIAEAGLTPAQAEFARGLRGEQLAAFVTLCATVADPRQRIEEPTEPAVADADAAEYQRAIKRGLPASVTLSQYLEDRAAVATRFARKD